GCDHGIDVQDELRSRDRHRGTSPTGIWIPQTVADAFEAHDLALLYQHLRLRDQEAKVDPFDLGFAGLLFVDEHFVARATVYHVDLLRALAQRGARTVHCGEAAADDGHAAADGRSLVEVG